MSRALLFEVRLHEGRYHGVTVGSGGDWPPAPGRLFQALLAGSARGSMVPERVWAALAWLERRPPPVVCAPRVMRGQEYRNFVPNNDLDSVLSTKGAEDLETAVALTRVAKRIRPFLFEDTAPLLYVWSLGDDDAPQALSDAALDVYQFGRGVDLAWASASVIDDSEVRARLSSFSGVVYNPTEGGAGDRALLCPQPGTADSLRTRFLRTRDRFRLRDHGHRGHTFDQPPKPLLKRVGYCAPPTRRVFALREEPHAGFAPRRLRGVAGLVAEVRDRAAGRLAVALPADAASVERYVVGRGATEADKQSRVRILPIPSVGHPEADMMIRRVAVHIPQSCPLRSDDVAWAMGQVACPDDDGVIQWKLEPANDDSMADRYEAAGRRWRSVTPLALGATRNRPRDADRRRLESRAAHAVVQALRHEGVRVSPETVRVQREPFDRRGQRAESFAAGTRFSPKVLWHAEVFFVEVVNGPLVLGDGRYLGLGLMRPVEEALPGVLAFGIDSGLGDGADPSAVAGAARRAMMARVQRALPPRQRLPRYVSGHEPDGRPIRGGAHRHVAVVPDLTRRRLLFVGPHVLQRNGLAWRHIRDDHELMDRALAGMNVLRAGRAGRLALMPLVIDGECDPLFAPAQVWSSQSEYRATRHRRRLSDEEALEADVRSELDRIGWPNPTQVEVVSVRRGPRGALFGRLQLRFAVAQEGPLVIGRDLHLGGGLFVGESRSG